MVKLLLSYTIMAPSSHNTQPWKFRWPDKQIEVYADFDRWLTIADADQRELFISAGCALENLLITARAFHYHCTTTYFPDSGDESLIAKVDLRKDATLNDEESTTLFSSITSRRTYHHQYRSIDVGKPVQEHLQSLAYSPEVSLHFLDQEEQKRQIEELIIQADNWQFSDPAFRSELGYWIGQSVFGTPWLISKMGQWVVTNFNRGKQQSKKDTILVEHAPLLGILYTKTNTHEEQVKVGQAYERINLGCTKLGIGLQPLSQPLEVPDIKSQLAPLLPHPKWFPQHLFRLGYTDRKQKPTPRRPLEEFLL